MKKIYIIATFIILILAIVTFKIVSNPVPENTGEDLGALILKPSEATPEKIMRIREDGYKGVIYVPENKEIYGINSEWENQEQQIDEIMNTWNLS